MPIPGFSGFYQITGIGDMFVFALIEGATLKIWGIHAIWMAISAIIVGQMLLVCYLLRTSRGTVEFQQLRSLF